MKIYPTDKLLASQTFAFARWKKTEYMRREHVVLHANAFLFVLQGKKILLDGEAALKVAPSHALLMRRGVHFMSEYIPEGGSFEGLLIYFTQGLLECFLLQLASASPPPAAAQDYALLGTSPLLTSFVQQYRHYFSVSAPPDATCPMPSTSAARPRTLRPATRPPMMAGPCPSTSKRLVTRS
jgi:hypothetical protein